MPILRHGVVLVGPELIPHRCRRFGWTADTIDVLEIDEPVSRIDQGGWVIIPGLYNGHTHVGDSALPDGATGLTLAQGFFRPDGYKYRELARLTREEHLPHLVAHLRYMARTGTICHLDFREQGTAGAELLREASAQAGVQSIILSQFDHPPFSAAALAENREALPETARRELDRMLSVADGFSESTMNDLTDAAWKDIRAITSARGKLRAIHCLEDESYRSLALARTGRGDLAQALELYDPHLVVHLTVANADEIGRLVRANRTAVINPRANATLGLPLPPVAALLRAGANLLLGTDNGMLNAPSLWAELDFTYKLARSQFGNATMPEPSTVLGMVTRNVRAALGGEHYGYLEKGLPASFVVIDFNAGHLSHSRHLLASLVTRVTPADVLATYRCGAPLWQSPEFSCS